MPYFLRAINRENWPEPEENASVHDLDADALNDLKTQDNTLSVWYAEDDEELKAAIVAYLASMDRWVELEEVDFIALDTKMQVFSWKIIQTLHMFMIMKVCIGIWQV